MSNTKKLKRPKMSEAMKGKQNRLGKKLSEKAKKERRKRMGAKAYSPRRIPIIELATNTTYPSIADAASALGISLNTVYRSIRLRHPTMAGQRFVPLHERCPVGF